MWYYYHTKAYITVIHVQYIPYLKSISSFWKVFEEKILANMMELKKFMHNCFIIDMKKTKCMKSSQ